jgi:hypothetical protein
MMMKDSSLNLGFSFFGFATIGIVELHLTPSAKYSSTTHEKLKLKLRSDELEFVFFLLL